MILLDEQHEFIPWTDPAIADWCKICGMGKERHEQPEQPESTEQTEQDEHPKVMKRNKER